MDPAFFQTWVPIALGVINLGGWGWAILQSPAKENAKAISKLADAIVDMRTNMSTQIIALEKRTSTLEDAYKHLPDKESIHRLEMNMEKISGAIGVMGAEMKAVRDISIMTRDMITKDTA